MMLSPSVIIPRLRDDLIIVEQEQSGKPYFVIKDPDTGKFLGLNSMSHRMLQWIDGESSIDDLVSRVTGDPAKAEKVRPKISAFVDRLEALGLLEGSQLSEDERDKLKAERGKRNPLYIRFGTVDPSRVLRRLDWLFFPVFTLWGLLVLTGLLVASGWLIQEDWRRFMNSYLVFNFFSSWAIVWVVLILTTFLHELAHGMACRRFGGEVREMGFLLYLIQPGCYTNVSDAWLFPNRWHRIVVSLAGVYIEAFVLCATVFVWYYTRPFSLPNQTAFVLGNILLFRMFLNLYPFLRLDGYFVLTDLVQIRNLRPRAFRYLLSKLPLVSRVWDEEKTSRREKIVFITYGVCSIGSVVYILYRGFLFLHGVLWDWRYPWGILLFLLLFVFVVGMGTTTMVTTLWKQSRAGGAPTPRELAGQAPMHTDELATAARALDAPSDESAADAKATDAGAVDAAGSDDSTRSEAGEHQ